MGQRLADRGVSPAVCGAARARFFLRAVVFSTAIACAAGKSTLTPPAWYRKPAHRSQLVNPAARALPAAPLFAAPALAAVGQEQQPAANNLRRVQGASPSSSASSSASASASASGSPSASIAASPSSSATTYPLIPTLSPLPSGASSGGGLVLLPPEYPVTSFVYGNRYSIFVFPLYNYISIFDEPDINVTVTLDASAAAPVTLTYSPLQWVCDDFQWTNWPLPEDYCSWDGDGAPAGYWVDTVVNPGQTLVLNFNSATNSSLYPAYWYLGSGMWLRFTNPDGNPPALLNLVSHIGAQPSNSPSPSQNINPVIPSASVLPSGALSPTGLISLLPSTPVMMVADTYALTYLVFNVPPQTASSLPIRLNVTSLQNDVEVWLSPFNYVCDPQGFTNIAWWDSNCTWLGAGVAEDEQSNYYDWDVIPSGTTTLYDFYPNDTYMYPSGAPNQTGIWIGLDAFNWGEAALYMMTAYYITPPSGAPSWSSSPGASGVPPPPGGNNNSPTSPIVVIAGAAGGGVAVCALIGIAAVCLIRGRRNSAGTTKLSHPTTGPKRASSSRMADLASAPTMMTVSPQVVASAGAVGLAAARSAALSPSSRPLVEPAPVSTPTRTPNSMRELPVGSPMTGARISLNPLAAAGRTPSTHPVAPPTPSAGAPAVRPRIQSPDWK